MEAPLTLPAEAHRTAASPRKNRYSSHLYRLLCAAIATMSAETWQAVRAELAGYESKSAAMAMALQLEKEQLAATEGATAKLNEGETLQEGLDRALGWKKTTTR